DLLERRLAGIALRHPHPALLELAHHGEEDRRVLAVLADRLRRRGVVAQQLHGVLRARRWPLAEQLGKALAACEAAVGPVPELLERRREVVVRMGSGPSEHGVAARGRLDREGGV